MASSVNDNIRKRTGLPGNEGLSAWYGRTAGESLNDAERRWLLANDGTTSTTASNQDLWKELFRKAGLNSTWNYWDAPPVFKLSDSEISPIFGSGGTFTRATVATVADHEGVIREVVSGEVRFQGQRRVENLAASTDTPSTQGITVVSGAVYQVSVGAGSASGATAVLSGAATGTLTGDATNGQSFDTAKTATTTTLTITISGAVKNLQVEHVTGQSNQAPAGYVSNGTLSSPYHGANVNGVKYFLTTNGNSVTSGIITYATGSPLTNSANWRVGFGTGDSFADFDPDWPFKVNATAPYGDNFTSTGRAGEGFLGAIGDNFAADIAATTGGFVILQGGINDADTETADDMFAAVKVMEAEAAAQGKNFAVINISPFGNYVSWNSAMQAVVDSYNSLTAAWASANNIPYADIYTALEDGGSPDDLAAAYDNGDGLHPNAAGSQVIADTIIAAIDSVYNSDSGRLPSELPIGHLIEGVAINRAIYNRDFTNAAWVKTNITAAKDAVGVDGTSNSASTLTATAGNGTCFQTVTLTSAQRASSLYIKRKTGTGTIEFTDDGGASYTDITTSIGTSVFHREGTFTTQANPSIGFRIGTSGDEIEVDAAQIEDGQPITSSIFTEGSAVTRNKDDYSYPTTSIPVKECVFSFDWTPTGDSTTTIMIFGAGSSTDRIVLFHTGSTLTARKRLSSTNYDATYSVNYSENVTYSLKIRLDSALGIDLWLDNAKGTGNSNASDAIIGSEIVIGADYNNILHQTGGIANFTVYKGSFTDSEVVAL